MEPRAGGQVRDNGLDDGDGHARGAEQGVLEQQGSERLGGATRTNVFDLGTWYSRTGIRQLTVYNRTAGDDVEWKLNGYDVSRRSRLAGILFFLPCNTCQLKDWKF